MYICSEGEERRKETVNRAAGVAVFAAGSFVSWSQPVFFEVTPLPVSLFDISEFSTTDILELPTHFLLDFGLATSS